MDVGRRLSVGVRVRRVPWLLRLISWWVVVVQVVTPLNWVAVVGAESILEPSGSNGVVEPPKEVRVNRTLPMVERPSPRPSFSTPPTDLEIFRARVFGEPLVPFGPTTAEENSDLAQALLAFSDRTDNDSVGPITDFLERHPRSAWRASVLGCLGLVYRRTGYISRALDTWEEAWRLAKEASDPRAKALADRVLGELADLNARLGRYERLEPLFTDIQHREVSGSAWQKVVGAREGLWLMQNEPEVAFLCGPCAVERVHNVVRPLDPRPVSRDLFRSSPSGTSLTQVRDLATAFHLDYQMAHRQPGGAILLPAVVHWRSGHFAAVIREAGGLYEIQDPTFGHEFWVSRAALEDEASGYFLVPAGTLPSGWRSVSEETGSTVWGRGNTAASDPNRTRAADVKSCGSQGGIPMAQYAFHAMVVSLNIVDTPVGYTPPRGPAVRFKVTYNQREANQPANFTYSNLGKQWTFDWLAYIVDDPLNPLAKADYYVQGGGTEPHTNFDTNTQAYALQPDSNATLVRTSSNSYERRLPNGAKQVFDQVDGATTFPRKIFLTRELDPLGNNRTNTYDGSLRLVAVSDAIGQVTTIDYASTNATNALFYQISKVTDPFGRYATFDYNGSGQLTNITDILGIKSSFTYTTNDIVNSLTTPYGTTTFEAGEQGRDRWLEATDQFGQKERMEFQNLNTDIPMTESSVPTGVSWNNWLAYRNSYYWDKKAMQLYPEDVTKARVYHWLHVRNAPVTTASGVLESIKEQFESRIWFSYPGQTNSYYEGTNASPLMVARLLDGNTNQISRFEYNALGRLIKVTDPAGRATTNIYATNLIDLTEVRQIVGTNAEPLAKLTYNSQHLPLTIIDASGKTNSFGYNAYGQVTTVTNALGEVVTLAYNTNGYLTNIVGALPGATVAFTYDGYGRVRTVTDSDGYAITTDYDAADRPTQVTYPDLTYEKIVYDRLDPVLQRDRRGHWTSTRFDALRRLKEVIDPAGRVTTFEWCGCGSLDSITDGLNQTTTWERDLRGRVIRKIYPDTTEWTYTYETNSSRIKEVIDANLQKTQYQYFADDNLKQVTYTNTLVSTPSVSFTYATNYNRLLTMTDGNGTTTYSYYPITNSPGAGRLQSVDGPWTNDVVTYTYDELGRVSTRAIDTQAVKLTYDALSRVSVVTNTLGSFTNLYYGATHRLGTNTMPNGQVAVLSYFPTNQDLRLQTLHHKKSGGTTLSKFDYTYDADGQIATWTQQADASTPSVWVTDYDRADQLLGVAARSNSASGTVLKQYFYGYDKAGNRTTEALHAADGVSFVTSAGHNEANQLTNVAVAGLARFRGALDELGTVTVAGSAAPLDSRTTNFVGYATTASGTNTIAIVATDYSSNRRTNKYQLVVTTGAVARTLTFDANGSLLTNATSTLTNTYEWDGASRLVAINSGTNRSEFTYDGNGRRTGVIEKQNGTAVSTNRFLWCGTELCEERDATGATVSKRFFGQGEQISGTKYYFTGDHLGSIRELTDTSGNVVSRYDYDPFGRRTKISGGTEADFGFTGHYIHPDSGHHLALYRGYDADTGRWLSRDPIGEAGGINLYQYCYSDPINHIDPDGETPLVTGLIGAGIGAAIGAGVAAWKGGSWGDIGYGALRGGVAGGVAGLTLGFGGAALAGTFGGGITGGALAGAVASGAGDLAAQGLDNATGRRCGIDPYELAWSAALGGLFGGAALRPYTAPNQPVTSWASAGVTPNLDPGRWVMTGGPSVGNYLRTVGSALRGYPYGNSVGGTLPGSSLAYPPGATGNLAGLLGQRVVVP